MASITGTFGTLTDYATGAALRPATAVEWRRSAEASHASPWNGVFEAGSRAVWVDGGPDMNPHRDAIIVLRGEAEAAGDPEMARIADTALGINGQSFDGEIDAAWGECVRVILDNRAESVTA